MSGELEKELRGAVAHEKKMGVQGGWMEDLGSLLDTIDALRTELATERAAREAVERERGALLEAVKPFVDAVRRQDAEDLRFLIENGGDASDMSHYSPDDAKVYSSGELRGAVFVTKGDFRRLAALTPPGEKP